MTGEAVLRGGFFCAVGLGTFWLDARSQAWMAPRDRRGHLARIRDADLRLLD